MAEWQQDGSRTVDDDEPMSMMGSPLSQTQEAGKAWHWLPPDEPCELRADGQVREHWIS